MLSGGLDAFSDVERSLLHWILGILKHPEDKTQKGVSKSYSMYWCHDDVPTFEWL